MIKKYKIVLIITNIIIYLLIMITYLCLVS
jgi:hypothetical protein